MTFYGKCVAKANNFANALFAKNVAVGNEVQKFTVYAILYRNIWRKKNYNLMVYKRRGVFRAILV